MPTRRTETVLTLDLTQEQQVVVMRALGMNARVLEVPTAGALTLPFGAGHVTRSMATKKMALTSWQKAELQNRLHASYDYIELVPGMTAFQ